MTDNQLNILKNAFSANFRPENADPSKLFGLVNGIYDLCPTSCIQATKDLLKKIGEKDGIPISKMHLVEKIVGKRITIHGKYLGQNVDKGAGKIFFHLIKGNYISGNTCTSRFLEHFQLPLGTTRGFMVARLLKDGQYETYGDKGFLMQRPNDVMNIRIKSASKIAVWTPLPKMKSLPIKKCYEVFKKIERTIYFNTTPHGKKHGWSIFNEKRFLDAVMKLFLAGVKNNAKLDKDKRFRCANLEVDTWVKFAMTSAIIWCGKEGVFENCVELDICKSYLYIYLNELFPVNNGTVANGAPYNDGRTLKYGLYQVDITAEECAKETPPRFRYTKHNVYTHIDIEQMREHKYKHKIFGSCLVWAGREKTKGYTGVHPVFKPFGERMHKMLEICPEMKHFVNPLWGMLTEKSRNYKCGDRDSIFPYIDVMNRSTDKETNRTKIFGRFQGDNFYKHNGVMGVFMIAFGRKRLNDFMDKIGRDKVLQVHTDGFLIQGDFDKKVLGNHIGDLRVKTKSGTATIHHSNNVHFGENPNCRACNTNIEPEMPEWLSEIMDARNEEKFKDDDEMKKKVEALGTVEDDESDDSDEEEVQEPNKKETAIYDSDDDGILTDNSV